MTYACPSCEFAADSQLLELQRLQKDGSPQHWKLFKAHTDPRIACGFQNAMCL
jgi:hypothetical protein